MPPKSLGIRVISPRAPQGQRLSLGWLLALGFSLGIGLGAPVNWSAGLLSHPAQAQVSPDPFQDQGIVYVLNQGQWQEARIRARTLREAAGQRRWVYWVEFLDSDPALRAQVTPDQMRTMQQAQAQGLTTNVYDLSSQTGVNEMLTLHNDLRRQVGVSPLNWSRDLAESAQAWAEFLLANNGFYHSPNQRRRRGRVGENLHQRMGPVGTSYATPRRAIAGWITEGNHYTYATHTCTPGQQCGHYLQMVWGESREVGCGMARSADARREVWACHYYPGGIVLNLRPY